MSNKKSAASKGYRKPVKERPFLTKKEIIVLIAIVAAIALVIILFNLFYDDGYVSAKEVQPGDIVAYASQDVHSRYAKLGVANELDGFTRTEEGSDTNALVSYYYSPDDETNSIDFISVSGSFVPADQLASNTLANYAAYGSEANIDSTELYEASVQGYDAYIFGATTASYNAELDASSEDDTVETEATTPAEEAAETETPVEEETEAEPQTQDIVKEITPDAQTADTEDQGTENTEEKAPNSFSQNLSCYVAVGDSRTLCFHIYLKGEDESFYIPEDQIVDYVLSYTDAFSLVPQES